MVAPFAAMAALTRISGLFLLVGLLVEFLSHRPLTVKKAVRTTAALAFGLLPLLAYGAYLWTTTGTPFDFLAAQRRGWGRSLTSPLHSVVSTWQVFAAGRLGNASVTAGPRFIWFGELLGALIGLAATGWAVHKRNWGFAAYMGSTMVALIVSGPTFLSIPRMLLTLFPIPLFLAEATEGRPLATQLLPAGMASLWTLGLLIYTGGTAWFY
jgi:hypothetical protein